MCIINVAIHLRQKGSHQLRQGYLQSRTSWLNTPCSGTVDALTVSLGAWLSVAHSACYERGERDVQVRLN